MKPQKPATRSIAFFAVLSAFGWNLLLLLGVILNVESVRTLAAGGQFESFPVAIRVVYGLQFIFVAFEAWTFTRIFRSASVPLSWLPKLFFVVGILGTLLNAISKSAYERINVIPAAIITWAFWRYGIKKKEIRP